MVTVYDIVKPFPLCYTSINKLLINSRTVLGNNIGGKMFYRPPTRKGEMLYEGSSRHAYTMLGASRNQP